MISHLDDMRFLPKEQTLARLEPPLPFGQSLPGGACHLALLLQPHQILGSHEEDLASIAFPVPVWGLLESKEDLSVNDLRFVTTERSNCAARPRVCSVNLCPVTYPVQVSNSVI